MTRLTDQIRDELIEAGEFLADDAFAEGEPSHQAARSVLSSHGLDGDLDLVYEAIEVVLEGARQEMNR